MVLTPSPTVSDEQHGDATNRALVLGAVRNPLIPTFQAPLPKVLRNTLGKASGSCFRQLLHTSLIMWKLCSSNFFQP